MVPILQALFGAAARVNNHVNQAVAPHSDFDALAQAFSAPNLHLSERIHQGGTALTDGHKQYAIPVAVALKLLLRNKPDTHAELSNDLVQASVLAALPGISVRATNAVSDIWDSNDKLNTAAQVAPTALLRSLSDLSPAIIHRISQRF